MPTPKPWYVYILIDDHGHLYIGITQNLTQRIAKHQHASGTMHTAKLINPKLAYTETFPTRQAAQTREKYLKHLPRNIKLTLITSHLSH